MNKTIEESKGITETISNTGKSFFDKGIEFSKSETIQNFAKKTNDTINFCINWLIGNQKEERKENEEYKKENENKNEYEKDKIKK